MLKKLVKATMQRDIFLIVCVDIILAWGCILLAFSHNADTVISQKLGIVVIGGMVNPSTNRSFKKLLTKYSNKFIITKIMTWRKSSKLFSLKVQVD